MLALEINNLVKIYDTGVQALSNINLQINQGDFFALLGPNGAGKSTTIGMISKLVNITSGTIKIFGHDLEQEATKAKALMGLVPQEINFNQFEKVIDIVVNQAGFYGVARNIAIPRAEKVLKQLGLWTKKDSVSRKLSGGMKRRLMIARALIHNPKILILDEPTAGVDIELRRGMWQFLKELNNSGTTIILTTHYLEEAEYLCKGIAIIDQGKILINTTVRQLLMQLEQESYILELEQELLAIPETDKLSLNFVDMQTLELIIVKNQTINEVFIELDRLNIKVKSMRNKANRLEELFIRLVGHAGAANVE